MARKLGLFNHVDDDYEMFRKLGIFDELDMDKDGDSLSFLVRGLLHA